GSTPTLCLPTRREPVVLAADCTRLPGARLVVFNVRPIEVEDAAQLADRLGMFADPKIDQRGLPLAIDHQRCGMLPAMLAACIATGLERRHQAWLEILARHLAEGRGHGARGALRNEGVAHGDQVGLAEMP